MPGAPTTSVLRFYQGGLLAGASFCNPATMVVNPSHPLSEALVSCFIPDGVGNFYDLCNALRCDTAGTRSIRPLGPGSTGASCAAASRTSYLNVTSGQLTLAIVGYVNATATNEQMFNWQNYVNDSNNQGWALGLIGGVSYRFNLCNNNPANGSIIMNSVAVPAVGNFMMAGTSDGVLTRQIFINGELDSTNSTLGVTAAANSTQALQFSPTGGFCDTHLACVWRRVLSNDEMRLLWRDPYCFLIPLEKLMSIVSLPAAAGGLFLPSLMNGLGAGGPYFRNPLG